MSDELTAVSGAESQVSRETPGAQTQQPAPEPSLSADALEGFRRSRDVAGLRKAIEASTSPREPAGQPPANETQQQPDGGSPPSEGGEQSQKVFRVRYQGQERELDDSDTYLGYGSFGKLKKAAAHQKVTLDGYESRVSSAEAAAAMLRSENEELRRAQEESRRKGAGEPPPRDQQQQPQRSAPGGVSNLNLPEPPEEPVFSSGDPLDWTDEDRAKEKKYRASRAEYDKAMRAAVERIASGESRPGSYSNDPDLVKRLEEQQAYINELKGRDEAAAAEERNKSFWRSVKDFQGLHKEDMATPAPIEQLHEKISSWMDGLAWANGAKPPANANDNQIAEYERQKYAIVEKYLRGDAETLEASTAVAPPDGYKQYFAVAKYQKLRNRLINEGRLGPNATLQDAWEKDYVARELDRDVNSLESQARSEGSRSVLDSLGTVQREFSAHIPNNAAVRPSSEEASSQEISKEEALQILRMPLSEVRRDPVLMRKRSFIVSRLKAT